MSSRVEKGCNGLNNPTQPEGLGLKRVESPLGLNPSTLPGELPPRISPRRSARAHLPALDESFPWLRSTFAASLERLTTPDGEWGEDPLAGMVAVPLADLMPPSDHFQRAVRAANPSQAWRRS